MPAYNFQERFVDLIVTGKKRTTIRRQRKKRTRGGDKLTFYTGQRTSRCTWFADARCVGVYPVMILPYAHRIMVNGNWLSNSSMLKLAKADGFDGIPEFFQFFKVHYQEKELKDFELIEFVVNGCMDEGR